LSLQKLQGNVQVAQAVSNGWTGAVFVRPRHADRLREAPRTDALPNLLAIDCHLRRRFNPQANGPGFDRHDLDGGRNAGEDDGLIQPAREYQHGISDLKKEVSLSAAWTHAARGAAAKPWNFFEEGGEGIAEGVRGGEARKSSLRKLRGSLTNHIPCGEEEKQG
jgi:hypothetical protein